jgi:hypothetical protein
VIDNGPASAIVPREGGFTHPRGYFATDKPDLQSTTSAENSTRPGRNTTR